MGRRAEAEAEAEATRNYDDRLSTKSGQVVRRDKNSLFPPKCAPRNKSRVQFRSICTFYFSGQWWWWWLGLSSPAFCFFHFSPPPPPPSSAALLRVVRSSYGLVARYIKKIRRGTDMFVDNFFFRGLCIFIEGGARVEFFLPFPCCVPPFLSYSGSLPPAFNKLCLCPLSVINRCAYFFFSPLPFCPSAGLSTEHALPGYTQYARRFFLCTPAAQATAATGPRPASARRHGHRQHF